MISLIDKEGSENKLHSIIILISMPIVRTNTNVLDVVYHFEARPFVLLTFEIEVNRYPFVRLL